MSRVSRRDLLFQAGLEAQKAIFKVSALSSVLVVCGIVAPVSAEPGMEYLSDPMLFSDQLSIAEDERFNRDFRPQVPKAQHPELANEENVDTGRPLLEWQSATDDWFGIRPQLDDRGITFQSDITIDTSWMLRGGVNNSASAVRHLFNANLTLDTERLEYWDGGVFFINFQNQAGENGSIDVGDFQGFSNIDNASFTEISELWYEQTFSDGKLRIKLGKVDGNSEFAYVDHGVEFINSSMGLSPTIFVMPTYPDPATSLNVFVYPTQNIYVGVGLYDGATQDGGFGRTGNRGPSTFFGDPSDLFLISELGTTWSWVNQTLPGRLGVGGWTHTGSFTQFDGGIQSGTEGVYLVFDQQLWRENVDDEEDEQGIGMFVQCGWADEDVSEVNYHFGAGAVWTGAIPTRDADVLGLGATWVDVSNRAGAGFTEDSELTIEAFYKIELMPSVYVKPDFQYIVSPGGLAARDAIVGTVRVGISF